MKKTIRTALSFLLCALLICGAAPVSVTAAAEAVSGTCGAQGDSLTWSFDPDTGVLTIDGSGGMADFDINSVPWMQFDYMITSVSISDGVTHIGAYSFAGCNSLSSITIPDGLTSIGAHAFAYTYLSDVMIPDGVTSIGAYAFADCMRLRYVYIPDTVNEIGEGVFDGTTAKICLDNALSFAAAYAEENDIECIMCCLSGAFLIQYTIQDDEVTVTGSLTNAKEELTIPAEIEGYPVTGIAASAFQSRGLTKVTIPESVTSIGNTAFRSCSRLASVVWNAVNCASAGSSAANSAFNNCGNLQNITFGENVQTIPSFAFYNCRALEHITIPAGVTSVGESSFRNCTGLTSVTWNAVNCSVSGTGTNAMFYSCNALQNVTFGENVQTIPSYVFNAKRNLKHLNIPDSVTSIGYAAFSGCTAITDVTIGSGVTSIGDSAFNGCTNIASVCYDGAQAADIEIGTSNTPLQDAVWYYHTHSEETETMVCNTVAPTCSAEGYTGDVCYAPCGAFKYAGEPIPIDPDAHQYAYRITATCTAEGSRICSCTLCGDVKSTEPIPALGHSYNAVVTTEPTCTEAGVMTYTCTVCGYSYAEAIDALDHAFGEWVVVTAPTITAEGLERRECTRCGAAEEQTIPALDVICGDCGAEGGNVTWSLRLDTGVLTISGTGEMADYSYLSSSSAPWKEYSASILTIVIEDGVTSIGNYAFSGCVYLTSAIIPVGMINIGESAFSACWKLADVTIPESLLTIGANAFWGSSITSVTIPNGVTSIGYRTFGGCEKLTSVTIGNAVETIGNSAFAGCSKLTSVTIPDSVTTIGAYAFEKTALPSIYIPAGVTSIGSRAFFKCSNITSFTVDLNNQVYCSDENGVLYNKEKTRLIQYPIGASNIEFTIPNSVTKIGEGAFGGSQNLSYVTIPNSVYSIGSNAFEGCTSLVTVSIPESVTSIGYYAFASCKSMTSVTIPNGVTSIGNYVFSGCTSLANVTIPGSVTIIKDNAFSGCTSLASIHIPASVTEISGDAFDGCGSALTICSATADCYAKTYAEEKGIPFRVCTEHEHVHDYDAVVTVEPTCTEAGVITFACVCGESYTEAIPALGHSYNAAVTEATCTAGGFTTYTCTRCGDSYTSDETPALGHDFGEWTVLTEPTAVEEGLEQRTCTRCGATEEQTIPALDVVGGECGAEGSNVTWSLQLSTGVLTIAGSGAMESYSKSHGPWYTYRDSIQTLVIENGVTGIGKSAFYDCTSLTSVTIPDSVTSIGSWAFTFCESMTSVTIPSGVTCIETHTFDSCESLADVTIPNGVTSIDFAAFSNCTRLVDITIPGSVTSIGDFAFSNCTSLASVHIPSSVTTIGSCILDGTSACVCCGTADCYAKTYADTNGIPFRVCADHGDHTHSYNAVVTTEPTCTEAGVMTYACVCGESYTEAIPALGHSYNAAVTEATCTEGGFTTYTCSRCGDSYTADETPALGHDFGEWTVVTAPTEESEGLEKRTCTRCDVTEERPIDPLPGTPTVAVQDAVVGCSAGRLVKVTVDIQNNSGIIATRLHIGYDTRQLELVKVENGTVFREETFLSGGSLALEPYTVQWSDDMAATDVTADGTLVTLTFRVQPTATAGKTAVTVTYDAISTFNTALEYVELHTANGAVQIVDCTPGDANGDGVISLLDSVMLTRFLAGGWGVTVNAINGDVDGDGEADLRDAVLIRRFLAGGWDVVLI